ncbi:MAG: TonB-dependent receptor [Sphingomonadaceae bacterium]|nr:TonB-dependent receptor [Sphingomonadaceae bacterium]
MKLRTFLLVSACALAPVGTAALAQDAAQDAESNGSKVGYGDIIVTAQRKSELARDVPISLTTLTSEQITSASITDTTGLEQLTPSLKLDRQGNFTAPALRGISATVTGPAMDNNIAIYLDGVYMPSTTSGTFDLPDVERVEVLKGPQGTLFGRNATGGAILIITKRPSYTPEGMISASYGNLNDVMIKGFVSVPLIADKVAIGLSAYYHNNDSYYNNIRPDSSLEGEDSFLIRGKLRLNPTDNLEILLAAAYGERSETYAIYGTPIAGNTLSRVLDENSIIASRPYDVALNDVATPQETESLDLSARIELTLPGGTLTSITAYLERDLVNSLDADTAYAPNGLGINYLPSAFDEYFSQELSYSSDLDGQLNFTLGAYYTDGAGGWTPLGVDAPGAATDIAIFSKQSVESIAVFGEAYFDLTDRLTLIGGLRYSWEERILNGTGVFGVFKASKPDLPYVGTRSWDSFTPRASIKYELTPTSNVYFTYSQGFKSGVWNANNPFFEDVVNPEKIKSYELGYKGRISDMLSFDAAAFYYDYTDLQTTFVFVLPGQTVPLSILRNAEAARVYGFEADAKVRFSEFFDMRIAGAYIDAKYKKFEDTAIILPCTDFANPCGTVGSPTLAGNNDKVAFDASGRRMPRAPKFTATVSANGHIPVGGGMLDLTGSLYYSSSVDYTVDGRIKQDAFAKIDARAAWSPNDSGFTFAVFGKNLTNKTTYGGTFITAVSDAIHWAAPRTYGAMVEYRF